MATFIYVDESGDLGFHNMGIGGCSRFFTVAALRINGDEPYYKIKRIPKRIREKLLKRKEKIKNEFKFSKSSEAIRKRLIEELVKVEGCKIYAITIDKLNVTEKSFFKENPDKLHNYLVKELIKKAIKHKKNKEPVELCIDRCIPNSKEEEFKNHLLSKKLKMRIGDVKINISHKSSINEPCLQVADFAAGAINSKFERSNSTYVLSLGQKLNHRIYFEKKKACEPT